MTRKTDLLTQSEYAKSRGHSRQYISKMVKLGAVRLIKGKVDPRQADQALSGQGDTPKASISFWEAKRRKEVALATLRELELQERQGQLLDRNAIVSALVKREIEFKQAVLRLPRTLPPRLHNKSMQDMETIVREHCHACLKHLARGPHHPKAKAP